MERPGVGTATGRRENSLDQRMRGHTHFVMLLAVAMAGKFHELGIKRRHLDITHPARYHHAIVVHLSFQGFAYHGRSEEHTSELQSLMRISYAVFCLKKKITKQLYI